MSPLSWPTAHYNIISLGAGVGMEALSVDTGLEIGAKVLAWIRLAQILYLHGLAFALGSLEPQLSEVRPGWS